MLQVTIEKITASGKGILAADESLSTIAKRFNLVGLQNTPQNRQDYRELLFSSPDLNQAISGAILFEETLTQNTKNGLPFAEFLKSQNILTGIKVDKGLIPLANTDEEKTTQGLDGLDERLSEYKACGASFAKWRVVFSIAKDRPSMLAIKTNAHLLARYAAICQSQEIVPIVEPEVLMEGNHDIETCAKITQRVLHHVFNALYKQKVVLEHMILKPNMVVPGKDCPHQNTPEEVAQWTVKTLKRTVPAAVPSINFLSGGQSSTEATANLKAMQKMSGLPWNLSFSFGRALQEPCLKAWSGENANKQAAQQALVEVALQNKGHT